LQILDDCTLRLCKTDENDHAKDLLEKLQGMPQAYIEIVEGILQYQPNDRFSG